jgi:signal transduction histidine kinase
VPGHRGKLAQVVINLVHNAALATAAGRGDRGRGARARRDGAARADPSTIAASAWRPEVVARLGEPFFTTRGDRGSGLGVGICRRIVEEHGGTLAFTSTPGAGTTARVCLPALVGSAP